MDKELMLSKIKEHYNIDGESDFARFLGITPQTLHNWKKRNTFDITIVYTKCLNISAEWLITGKGEMLKKEQKQNNFLEEDRIPYQLEETSQVNDSVDYWKNEYFNLSQKYQRLQEEHTKLLNKKLQETLDALNNHATKPKNNDESSVA